MKCRSCGETLTKKTHEIPSYFGETTFLISNCYCGCIQINKSYSSSDDNIYDKIYSNPKLYGYGRYFEYYNNIKNKNQPLEYLTNIEDTYYGINKSIKKYLNKNSSILEIGSGLGYTTYALRESGYNAIGFDISKESVDKANTRFGNFFKCVDVFEKKANSVESFDAIICSEVIEHVDNPYRFLNHCYKYLNPNGILILTTPNRSNYDNNVIWKSSLPPVHISFFNKKSVNKLVNRTGGKILEFININNFYWKNPEFDVNSNNFKTYSKNNTAPLSKKSIIKNFFRFWIKIPYFGFLLLNLYNLFRNDMVLFGKNNASKVIVSVIKKNNMPVKSNL